MNEPAQMLHVALACRRQYCAGAEEQETLENRMVEYMQEARRERQCHRPTHVIGPELEREAKPNEDNPDILHGMISEKAFEVVLHERVKNPMTAVPPPAASTETLHHQAASWPRRSKTMRMKP
jgi:hypothetical protein